MYEITHGQYGRALHELSGVPAPGRSEAEQANLRGLALMMQGDVAKAIESFEIAIELEPSLGVARFNRGIALLRSDDYARAATQFETIAADRNDPLHASAAYHQALALDALGRADEAERAAAKALEADPALDDALLFKALLQERRGDLAAAGASYKAYLAKHPDSPVAMLRFGLTAQRAGFPDTAKKYLRRVVESAPGTSIAVEAQKFLVMWE